MSTTIITPAVLQGGELAYSIFAKLLDVFRPQERITIEYRGPNYERVSFFWGLFDIESGEKQTIIIEGPPGFCQAAVAYLKTSGPDLHIRDRRLLE